MHFLIFIVVVFGGFETELLDDSPLFVVELDQVVDERRGVGELEEFNRCGSRPHSQVKDIEVGAAQVVEHILVIFLSCNEHCLWLQVEAKLVPNLASNGAEVLIRKQDPKQSLQPDRAEKRLIVVQDLHQQSLPWHWLVLEETLEQHGNLEARAPLHELANEEAQVARDVVRLEHVDG